MNPKTAILVAAVLAAGTLTAAPAQAATPNVGSIVYVKNSNVWIARGNGTGARAVTSNGTRTNPYRSPSEANGGVIAAGRGSKIIRMTQHGHVLNTIDPPALHNSAGEPMDGVVNEVAISPDGSKIAWSYVRYSCPVGVECMARYATGYTAATRYARVGRPNYFHGVSWVTNTRALVGGGYGSQVMLHDITKRPAHWFDDSDYANPSTDLSDGEVSPNGRWAAEVRGYGSSESIIWYAVSGNVRTGAPPAVPAWKCYTNPTADVSHPTWSPDSNNLAFAIKTGIQIERNAASCTSAVTLLAGGSQPDWSSAPLR
ncbi:MAG TPA: hypothetical protein VGH43_15285 [Jatrophihabitans sp.]|jgi:hypothetical protein